MAEHGFPVLCVLFLWWSSTGLILYLDGLPRSSFRWTMLGATILALAALAGLWATKDEATVAGAYAAFACGLALWGWHETSFLLGFVTGPRRTPCPEGSTGWRRFGHATEAVLHHELAIAATAAAVAALTWGGANQVGTWTFLALWLMRLSAKLNLFLGVPNLAEELLPPHLRYLRSFFDRKPMNPLFPVSVTAATAATLLLAQAASVDEASAFEAAAFTFLAALMALAVLEHWFLVLPLPETALWGWALRARAVADPLEAPRACPAAARRLVPAGGSLSYRRRS